MMNAQLKRSASDARIDPSRYPVLDEKQVGSLRHIGNLARQPKNDWSHMMGPTAWAEDFGAYRYQLAYMSYALALAHFHRLPAAPGYFQATFDKLIQKMMLPDVWYEWRDTSKGGGILNYDIPMTEGWVDPIVKDNIMYSAYLQSMTLLYNVLFNDDKYAASGALTLKHNPLFWGGQQGHSFEYDQNSVNERVYWNMVENGYLGVACEPNCVFQACNQPAILGFRLHDVLTGGNRAEEVTKGYLAAWQEFGGVLDDRGHYNTVVRTAARQVLPGHSVWSDAWCGALMNAWNSEFVKKNYAKQRDSWLIRSKSGTLFVNLPPLLRPDMPRDALGDFGWLAVWASEMGDAETLNGLLAHADHYMKPDWRTGGYFYPRNDQEYDEEGNLVSVHPLLGNALLPYARLNVSDGLHQLYERPWQREHFSSPSLTEVSFDVDLLRAVFDEASDTLFFDARNRKSLDGGEIVISNVFSRGSWVLTLRGIEVASSDDGEVNHNGQVAIRRDGDRLRLSINHSESAAYMLTWR
jgi:hypothetical protein